MNARHKVLGGLNLGLAVLLLAAIWIGLPARWWPVDVFGTALGFAIAAAGAGLLRGAEWARRVAASVSVVTLVVGASIATTLAWTASHLAGLYGPVGAGGAILLVTIAMLMLPYLVVFPAVQLWALRKERG